MRPFQHVGGSISPSKLSFGCWAPWVGTRAVDGGTQAPIPARSRLAGLWVTVVGTAEPLWMRKLCFRLCGTFTYTFLRCDGRACDTWNELLVVGVLTMESILGKHKGTDGFLCVYMCFTPSTTSADKEKKKKKQRVRRAFPT